MRRTRASNAAAILLILLPNEHRAITFGSIQHHPISSAGPAKSTVADLSPVELSASLLFDPTSFYGPPCHSIKTLSGL